MASAKITKTMFSSFASISAETIASNDNLLTQILVRLPIKSLLKFKCVSKHWLSLISDPHLHRHLNLSDSPCALFVHRLPLYSHQYHFIALDSRFSDAPFETLSFVNDPLGLTLIQSCNGLLLCAGASSYSSCEEIYIYNPTTRQYTTLPPVNHAINESGSYYLAFHPSTSPHYRVINIHQYEISEPEFNIEIYSSETGAWKVSATSFTLDNLDIGFYGGVLWHGAIHWYTDSGPSFCFDIDKEEIRKMPMPPIPEDWHRRRVIYFGESRGYLNLIEIYCNAATQFDVCEMDKNHSGWFVKYRVDLGGIISAFPEMIRTEFEPSITLNYYAYEIWCIVRGKSDEESYMVIHIPEKIIRYKLKDKSFEKLCDFSPGTCASYTHEDAMSFRYCFARPYFSCLSNV